MTAAPSSDCYRKALDLLARRPHLRRGLAAKLAARGFATAEVDAACDLLEERGLLNDLETARGLVAGAWRRKGYGPRRVRAELGRRGVADQLIETLVAEEFGHDEPEKARTVAARWVARSGGDRDRLARHLERKGFSGEAIHAVLRELPPAAATGAERGGRSGR